MRIDVTYDEEDGFSVQAEGETILECMGADEVRKLTIGEIENILVQENFRKIQKSIDTLRM